MRVYSGRTIRVDKDMVFLVIPDINIENVYHFILNSGFLLTNCAGIISPAKVFSIANLGRKFNARLHYYDMRKEMAVEKPTGKKLKVLAGFNPEDFLKKQKVSLRNETQFYFYNCAFLTDALKYFLEKFNPKTAFLHFFQELGKIRLSVKDLSPVLDVDVLFIIPNKDGIFYKFFVKNGRLFFKIKDFVQIEFFDNRCLISNGENQLLTMMIKNEKNVFMIQNLPKLQRLYQEETSEVEKSSATKEEDEEESEEEERVNIKKKLEKERGGIRGGIRNSLFPEMKAKKAEQKKLNRQEKPNEHDKPENEQPIKIRKLEKFKVPEFRPEIFERTKERIDFPPVYSIDPKRFVDLPPTSLPTLYKEEFGENLHKNIVLLLESLKYSPSGREIPIEVLKIERKLVDDDRNRYYEYKTVVKPLTPEGKEQKIHFYIPALVGGKYLKLRGNHYILSSQHFFKPITKTEDNEVRLISNSNYTIRLALKKLSVDPTNLKPLLTNLKIFRPEFLDISDEKVVFQDGSEIHFAGDLVYRDSKDEVRVDPETGSLVDQNGVPVGYGRYEFIVNKVFEKIKTSKEIYPFWKKHFKKLPYFQIYVGRVKLPLIYFLWCQKGIFDILKAFGIEYRIDDQKAGLFIPFKDKFINLFPKDFRQECLVNGLSVLELKRPLEDPSNPAEIRDFLAEKYGASILASIDLYVDSFIDPVTKELLKNEGHPTDLYEILIGPAIEKLLNEKASELADLRQYRLRVGEIIFSLLYSQLVAARHRLSTGKTDKLEVYPSFVIDELVGSTDSFGDQTSVGVLEYVSPVNPVDEIMATSRIIKTGRGGVRERRAFKAEHRIVHPTHYGNIAAAATPESTNVGLVSHHTLAPLLGKYGVYGVKDLSGSKFEYLSLSEALVPFQNQMMSDRLTMATIHARQVTPTDNLEPPLVQTGAEYLIPQLTSNRFACRAKKDGVVLEIDPGNIMRVKYKDGEEEIFDISPRIGRTKRGSYIFLKMQTIGGKNFKAGQLLAFTVNFKDDIYCSGKNVTMAVLNPLGRAFEDAYVVDRELANETTTSVLKKLSIVVDPKANVIALWDKLGRVENGQTLVEIDYHKDSDYFWMEEDEDLETTMYVLDKGSIKLLAHEGEIVAVRVLINNRVDKKVHLLHQNLVRDLAKKINRLVEGSSTEEDRELRLDNVAREMMKIGGHKYRGREFKGALITYYVLTKKPLREGDKISTRNGAKGVIGTILPVAPQAEFSGKVDVCISPSSIIGRQNLALLKELYVGKIFKFLNEKVIHMVNNRVSTSKVIRLIMDVYENLCPEIAETVANKINSLGESGFRRAVKNRKLVFYAIIPPFVSVDFDKIKTVADLLRIPLEERVKVRVGEREIVTEPVPVGVSYIQFLEHYSNVYQSVRGGEKYHPVTGAVTRGKKMYGGMAIGNLDCFALLTYDSPNIISELLGPRADHHRRKMVFYNSIITDGKARLEDLKSTESGGIYNLMRSYLIGLGFNLDKR
ncbi:MAG: hypothetical protein QW835_00320 [Candidatus Hadarchaeum sp.]